MNIVEFSIIVSLDFYEESLLMSNLDNLFNQTFKNFEIICLVSSDKIEFANKLKERDDKIKIVLGTFNSKEEAWNKGIIESRGNYITFLDNCFFYENSFEELFNITQDNNSDIIIYSSEFLYLNKDLMFINNDYEFDCLKSNTNEIFTMDSIKSSIFKIPIDVSNKLYNREFLNKYDLYFNEDLMFSQFLFFYQSYFYANEIYFLDKKLLCQQKKFNGFDFKNYSSDLLIIFKLIKNLFKNSNDWINYSKLFYNEFILLILNLFNSLNYDSKRILWSSVRNYLITFIPKKDISLLDINILNIYCNFINSKNYDDFYLDEKNLKILNFNKNIKLSVIIPVYNAEKYLRNCLDSVIHQTLKNIEIICVDDNSSDGSADILKEYERRDNRIKVISNIYNEGAGYSRNRGLEIASGECIAFIDSDDWIDLNTYEIMYNLIKSKNLDFVMFQLINYNDDNGEFYEEYYYNIESLGDNFDNTVFNHKDVIDYNGMFKIAVGPVNKVYNAQFLQKINAKFPEGLTFEDNIFFFNIFLNAKRVYLHREHLYYRRRHSSSVMSTTSNYIDSIKITTLALSLFKEMGFYELYKKQLLKFKLDISRNWFNKIQPSYKKKYYDLLHKDFKELSMKKSLCNDFKENLNESDFGFFQNVLKYSSLEEYDNKDKILDLKNELINSNLEINSLKSNINSLNTIINDSKNYKDMDLDNLNSKLVILKENLQSLKCKNELLNKNREELFIKNNILKKNNLKLVSENNDLKIINNLLLEDLKKIINK